MKSSRHNSNHTIKFCETNTEVETVIRIRWEKGQIQAGNENKVNESADRCSGDNASEILKWKEN